MFAIGGLLAAFMLWLLDTDLAVILAILVLTFLLQLADD